jgi:hypothetical protein
MFFFARRIYLRLQNDEIPTRLGVKKISFFPSSPAFPKMDVKAPPPLSDKIKKNLNFRAK